MLRALQALEGKGRRRATPDLGCALLPSGLDSRADRTGHARLLRARVESTRRQTATASGALRMYRRPPQPLCGHIRWHVPARLRDLRKLRTGTGLGSPNADEWRDD